LENSKLIASHDVQFNKDDTLSELASINLSKLSSNNINQLVDNAIGDFKSESKSLDLVPTNIIVKCPLTLPTSILSQSNPKNSPFVLKKSNKSSNLFYHKHLSCQCKLVSHYGFEKFILIAFLTIDSEPVFYLEMIKSPNANDWKKAMGSCIVYHKKVNGYGNYIKFKACIIAHGFSQVPSKDYSETFFSVVKFTTLYIFLLLVAFLDFDIYQVDIGGTYLEGNLDENIYM